MMAVTMTEVMMIAVIHQADVTIAVTRRSSSTVIVDSDDCDSVTNSKD
jgi:hypothetical protein